MDIVIPTLNVTRAAETVENLRSHSTYAHNYYIIDNTDRPKGYVTPCNEGFRAGSSDIVAFVNDDIVMESEAWDELLGEEELRGTYCFSPWMPEEQNMRLNGWFFCVRRDYCDVYGWAFDPRFVVWCGDVDLIMRLENDDIEHVYVKGIDVTHSYSKTCTRTDLQEWIVPQQLRDLDTFKEKWGINANDAKVRT